MTEDQDGKDSQSDSGGKTFTNKNKDKKTKSQRPLTKIILRRLPPTMTEEAFLNQVSPIPDHDHFYFAKPDTSLGNNVFSRAYINFLNVDDIYIFRDKFDGYIFLDEKGGEYVGIVEYAPFQRIPKKKKKRDPKCGSIESDPIYQEFIENLNKEPETENQPKLEYSYPINDVNNKKNQTTPLLEYLASRKQDKRGRDERRRRENDKRKMRIERKTKEPSIKEEEAAENEVKKIRPREWEKEKSSKFKDDFDKGENKDCTIFESKSYKEQRKSAISSLADKKKRDDKKENYEQEEKKEKEFVRDPKVKKYSETRKDRLKQCEGSDKQSVISKMMSAEGKTKSSYDDIKPFTQLPQVKTDDLTKIIEGMDRKMKLEETNAQVDAKIVKVKKETVEETADKKVEGENDIPKRRTNSLESEEVSVKEEPLLIRQKSLDERGKSTDREGSEEKDKNDNNEHRSERRIRNKDRPSLVIYQPGMGKFSKQRLAKEKDVPVKSVNDSEKKDT